MDPLAGQRERESKLNPAASQIKIGELWEIRVDRNEFTILEEMYADASSSRANLITLSRSIVGVPFFGGERDLFIENETMGQLRGKE